jgi:hypothetical protein
VLSRPATAGVAVSVLVVAAATRWFLGQGWRDMLLLGARAAVLTWSLDTRAISSPCFRL